MNNPDTRKIFIDISPDDESCKELLDLFATEPVKPDGIPERVFALAAGLLNVRIYDAKYRDVHSNVSNMEIVIEDNVSHTLNDEQKQAILTGDTMWQCVQQNGQWLSAHPFYQHSVNELNSIANASKEVITQKVLQWYDQLEADLVSCQLTLKPVHASFNDIMSKFVSKLKYRVELSTQCAYCGGRLRLQNIDIQNGKLRATYKSRTPQGCEVSVLNASAAWPIAIPSGQLMFADWFREQDNTFTAVTKDKDTSYGSLNHTQGRIDSAAYMATFQCAHGPVGNERTVIYEIDGGYIIGDIEGMESVEEDMYRVVGEEWESNPPAELGGASEIELEIWIEEHLDEEVRKRIALMEIAEPKKIGSICTDLWAYTLMDKSLFESMMAENEVTLSDDFYAKSTTYAGGSHPAVVEVPAGSYTHYYLSEHSVEEAISVLPPHIQAQLVKFKIDRLMGALIKNQ